MPISFNLAGSFKGVEGGPNVVNNPTSLQFGPDGRLYVSEQNGSINAFTVSLQNGQYIATDHEQLELPDGSEVVKSIQNHNDDGSLSGSSNRQVTGLVVAGTANNPVLYITSSDPRIATNNDTGLDTNSGVLTQVTWTGTEWEAVDLIRGLPRSEENHSNNGMVLHPDGDKLYLAVGGNTNNGAPSSFFSYTGEYALSGTVLEIDLVAVNALQTQVDSIGGQGGTPRSYKYDLPTLDDPNTPNDGVREDANGMDVAGPWGGNDGLNMAILPADAPLRIFADGFRNHYDLAITPDGKLYTVDNGSNGNLGGNPNTESGDTDGDGVPNEAINTPNNGGSGDPEPLFLIEEGGYYGHAAPVRSNQNQSWTVYDNSGNPDGAVGTNNVADISALVPNGVQIAPGFIIDPSKFAAGTGQTLADLSQADQEARLLESGIRVERSDNASNKIVSVGSSTNGIVVYDSNGEAFDGVLDSKLFVTQFNDNVTLLNLNETGDGLTPVLEEGPDGVFGTADDVVQSGGGDGILEVANNTLGVPLTNPLDVTVGPNGTLWVAEIGSNEITVLAPSDVILPGDNDSDDDGILNVDDPFLRDATNGTSVTIDPGQETVWEFSQDAGDVTPGPDGFGGGLTGVMINGTTDFEQFFQSPSPRAGQVIQLDNVKFVTAAGGGTTVIEEVSNGDPFQTPNDGEFLFHTGFQLADNVETFTVKWVVANPGAIADGSDITNNFQQIGGYIGDGTQSNYLKIVAIATNNDASAANIQIALEEGDSVPQTINLSADDIFNNAVLEPDSSIDFELEINPGAATAIPKATFTTTNGDVVITGGANDVIDLTGSAVLDTILGNNSVQGQEAGIATGLFASNFGSDNDTFQAVFDSITVSATEAEIAPDAVDDQFSTGVNAALDIPVADLLANDTDPNPGDVLAVTSVTNAQNGTAVLNDNGTPGDASDDFVVFTPVNNFEGAAAFDYTIEDSTQLTDTATVDVTVANEVILYRVNAGGAEAAATDGGPVWTTDTQQANSPFLVNPGSNNDFPTNGQPNTNVDLSLVSDSGVPVEVIGIERWDSTNDANGEMAWAFDVAAGTPVEVRLYLAELFTGLPDLDGSGDPTGDRIFDVSVDGVIPSAFDDLDPYSLAGNAFNTGVVVSHTLTSDGTVDLEFLRVSENPAIKGIEIIQVGGDVPDPEPVVSIISGNQVVGEDSGQVQISLATDITVPSAETVNVTFEIVPGTATPGEDYDFSAGTFDANTGIYTGTVAIAGSSSDATFNIDILQELPGSEVVEPDEAFTVNITGVSPNADIGTALATVTIEDDDVVVNPGGVVAAINTGGPALVQDGINFSADQFFSNGETFQDGNGGNGPQPVFDGTVFETERYGGSNTVAPFSYSIPVDPGDYLVDLYFAEIFQSNPGQRIFDVFIEDELVLDDYDILAETNGDINESIVFVAPRAFSPDESGALDAIDISFEASADNAKVSGIVIREAESAPVDTVDNVEVPGGDFSSDPATPNLISLTAEGSTTIVSNLEGNNGDRDFFTLSIPDGSRLVDIVLDGYTADTNNNGFFGIVLGSDFVLDPAIPPLGQSPDGTVEAEDLAGGIIYGPSNIGLDLLPLMNDGSIGSGFDEDALTGTISGWLNQGGDAVATTLTFVTEVIPEPAKAAALIEVTPNGGLGASTFGANSFQITNNSDTGVQITSVSFDLSSGILPDMVFDPTGSGGDATASPFTPNSGATETGLVAPATPAVDPFAQPRNGGFDVLSIDFTDFDPGEQFFFTTDVDPNSIQGVPGAGAAGAVSGYELIGSTVTVNFSDGKVITGSLYEDGSLGGAQVLVDSDVTAVAPTIELLGAGADESNLPGTQLTVSDSNQTVRVSGTVGDNISLLQMDARLFIASGDNPFDVSVDELPFYANEATAGKVVYSGVIGSDGFIDIPVMLLQTDGSNDTPDGGLNHFVAVTSPVPYAVDQPVSQTSDVLIVKQLDIPLVNGQPATIFVDETDTVVGNAIQAGEQPYQGSLFSDTDGTANPDDVILGTAGPDNLWGGEEGNDLIDAAEGDNIIGIGTGDVNATAGSGADFIYSVAGGGGINLIDLGEGDNEAYLEGGDNDLTTGSGTDLIGIGSGNDTVSSGGGDDFIYSVNDVSGSINIVDAGDGTNTIWLNGGDNTIIAGDGDDSIGLGNGTDIVNAGDGANIIYMIDPAGTTDGSKDILTGVGDDYVQTGSGNDSIDAGAGLNTLFGGTGADVFTVRSGAYNFLGDFELAIDQIELESLNFSDLSFFQGEGDVAADVFIFAGGESISQVANTTVAQIDNSANFV